MIYKLYSFNKCQYINKLNYKILWKIQKAGERQNKKLFVGYLRGDMEAGGVSGN